MIMGLISSYHHCSNVTKGDFADIIEILSDYGSPAYIIGCLIVNTAVSEQESGDIS